MTRFKIRKLLVVCAGNICRSPMAEALFRNRMKDRPLLAQIEVASAGTIAYQGNAPCPNAVGLMQEEFGLDIGAHRAQPFAKRIQVDLILTMDQATTEEVRAVGTTVPVEMIGDFVGTGEEVDDPYGGPLSGYQRVIRDLDRLVDAAIDRMEADARGARSPDRSPDC